jgi:hypothetical protein
MNPDLHRACVRVVCPFRYPYGRKAGQIVSRGASTWLVRVYLGRDPQTGTRKYHNQTGCSPLV